MIGADFELLTSIPLGLSLTAATPLMVDSMLSSDELSESSQAAESLGAGKEAGIAELEGLVTDLGGELRPCWLNAALVRLATGLMAACAGGAESLVTESVTSAIILGTGKTLPLQAAGALPAAAAATPDTSPD